MKLKRGRLDALRSKRNRRQRRLFSPIHRRLCLGFSRLEARELLAADLWGTGSFAEADDSDESEISEAGDIQTVISRLSEESEHADDHRDEFDDRDSESESENDSDDDFDDFENEDLDDDFDDRDEDQENFFDPVDDSDESTPFQSPAQRESDSIAAEIENRVNASTAEPQSDIEASVEGEDADSSFENETRAEATESSETETPDDEVAFASTPDFPPPTEEPSADESTLADTDTVQELETVQATGGQVATDAVFEAIANSAAANSDTLKASETSAGIQESLEAETQATAQRALDDANTSQRLENTDATDSSILAAFDRAIQWFGSFGDDVAALNEALDAFLSGENTDSILSRENTILLGIATGGGILLHDKYRRKRELAPTAMHPQSIAKLFPELFS